MKKKSNLETRKGRYGLMFVSPWIIGFILFFFFPLIQSVIFSFSNVSITESGFVLDFSGIKNYKYIFTEHPTYSSELWNSFGSFCYSLPIVTILSLILAVLLNQKFHGRLLARVIFFLPVIICSGVVMEQFYGDGTAVTMATDSSSVYFSGGIDYTEILEGMRLPTAFITVISKYIRQITMLVWNCSVPTILFLSGIQAIPAQLYEVSKVEGANPWEEFWYITFPMLGNILVVTVAFVAIDLLTNAQNKVISTAYYWITQKQSYDYGSAMLWTYFALVGTALALLFVFMYRLMLKKWK